VQEQSRFSYGGCPVPGRQEISKHIYHLGHERSIGKSRQKEYEIRTTTKVITKELLKHMDMWKYEL
jgi:hypothetical protein